jgi:hypothetical protein
MAKQTSKPVSITKFSGKSASSFWYDFDTNFKNGSELDLTKLAAAQRAIGNFVTIVTGKQIPVVFQSNDSSYTDGNRVVIGTKLEDKHFDPAVGLALHEGSHIVLTDFSLFKTSYGDTTSVLHNTKMADIARKQGCGDSISTVELNNIKGLLNWIEDRRIDYHVYTAAPGYRVYYEAMYNRYFNDKIIDKALVSRKKNKETWDDYMFHIINFTNPNRQIKTLKQLETIWTLIDLKHINRLHSTNDALLLSCELFKIIKLAVETAPVNAEKQKQKSNENTQSQSINQSSDNNESAISNSLDEAESDSNDSPQPQTTPAGDAIDDMDESSVNDLDDASEFDDTELDDDDDTELDEEDNDPDPMSQRDWTKLNNAIEKQRDFILGKTPKAGRLTKSQSAMVRALKESGTESRTVYTGAGKSNPIDAIVIKKLTASLICSLPELFVKGSAEFVNGNIDYKTCKYSNANDIREREVAVTKGIILGKQLGNKLQVRNLDKTLKTTRLQSGKIDRRLISQLGYNNVDVFHKIVSDRFKNYFIHISIDASGSMSGIKLKNAITSAVAIAQAASMTTGIRVQISFRGTASLSKLREKCVTLYAYDSAHDKMSKIRNLFKYLDIFGCTPEGLAFQSIESDIRKDAKGDECIFINYSDGEPTELNECAPHYNGVQFTKSVINSYRQLGINIISYFIYQGYVSERSRSNFKSMYGPDAQFIDPINMTDVSKTVNRKFLEKAI